MKQIYNIDTTDENDMRRKLYNLAIMCPIDVNPDYCPLHEIRKLPMDERMKWIDGLTHEKRVQLYLNHKQCMCQHRN